MQQTYNAKKVTRSRPSIPDDDGYKAGADQVVVTLEDGSTATVLRSDVKNAPDPQPR